MFFQLLFDLIREIVTPENYSMFGLTKTKLLFFGRIRYMQKTQHRITLITFQGYLGFVGFFSYALNNHTDSLRLISQLSCLFFYY